MRTSYFRHGAYGILRLMKQGGRPTASKPLTVGIQRTQALKLNHAKSSAGFTIVETMIVLAVTGVLLVSAITLISGRQNKTQFQVAANDLQQKMQQIVNETVNGYSQADPNFSCQPPPNPDTAEPVITPYNAALPVGKCIFIGKALRFGQLGSDDSNHTLESIGIYPLVASRLDASKNEQSNNLTVRFAALAAGGNNPTAPDSYTTYNTVGGLKYVKTLYQLASPNNGVHAVNPDTLVSGIVFAQSLASYSTGVDTSQLNSGSQQFTLYGLNNSTDWSSAANPDSATFVGRINGATLLPLQNIQLCFASGTTNQSVLVTVDIGLTVSMEIKNGPAC
jgi:type II secretory pathway pseudopilin PulG